MDQAEKIFSPYLKQEIELAEDRLLHITENHPDLLPEHKQRIIDVLKDPDEVRRSKRFGNALLFSRWFDDLKNGKHVVVVVVSEEKPVRNWIVTAYIARKLVEGDVEWKRN
ncbi:MAG: hypothetical protein IPJ69_01505 [Deltaproteobacteria bacterium]|nr:MAG: hypothetical protein IPJ69_01505 [Deltaproteobacteria bacterium]